MRSMEELYELTQKAKRWDMLCDAIQGFGMAFLLLLLCGWFRPYF